MASSCNWVSLAKNALTYREIQRGEAANLAALDTVIYATRAEDGLAIVGVASRGTLDTLAPPAGSESIDDLAISENLLFVLDARAPGYLGAAHNASFSLFVPALWRELHHRATGCAADRLIGPPLGKGDPPLGGSWP